MPEEHGMTDTPIYGIACRKFPHFYKFHTIVNLHIPIVLIPYLKKRYHKHNNCGVVQEDILS